MLLLAFAPYTGVPAVSNGHLGHFEDLLNWVWLSVFGAETECKQLLIPQQFQQLASAGSPAVGCQVSSVSYFLSLSLSLYLCLSPRCTLSHFQNIHSAIWKMTFDISKWNASCSLGFVARTTTLAVHCHGEIVTRICNNKGITDLLTMLV